MARSLVAGVNALFRREELSLPPDLRLVEDPWAAHLVERDPVVMAIRLFRHILPPLRRGIEELRTAHGARHASVDALVREGLEAGFRQVLILGAGYDMRAERLGSAHPEVRWFEVDRAPLLARKAQRLAGRVNEARVRRVGVELGREPLLPRLVEAGLDPQAPLLLVMEGLIHYLPREALVELLDGLLRGGRRRVVLTYIHPDMVPRASGAFRWLVRLVREIPRTWYTAEQMEELAARWGLRARSYAWAEQVRVFVPAAGRRMVGVSQEVGVWG